MRGMAQKSLDLIARAKTILEEINPATVRGVAYQFFTRNLIDSMARSEVAKVSRLLTIAREAPTAFAIWSGDEEPRAACGRGDHGSSRGLHIGGRPLPLADVRERPFVQVLRLVKNYRARFAECGTAADDGELGEGLFAAEAKLFFEICASRLAAQIHRRLHCCSPWKHPEKAGNSILNTRAFSLYYQTLKRS